MAEYWNSVYCQYDIRTATDTSSWFLPYCSPRPDTYSHSTSCCLYYNHGKGGEFYTLNTSPIQWSFLFYYLCFLGTSFLLRSNILIRTSPSDALNVVIHAGYKINPLVL